MADGLHYDADEIRDMLLDQRPSVALARFPLEQYQGTYTTDLFGEGSRTCWLRINIPDPSRAG